VLGSGDVRQLRAAQHHPDQCGRVGGGDRLLRAGKRVAGVRAGLRHRTRTAVVSSTTAWHQSSRVAASVRSPLVDSIRLDAAAPLKEMVARLNASHRRC
jgi:hypothetical protein